MKEIARQNDTLTAEVEKLSSALSSATKFIEETGVKYNSMRDELVENAKFTEKILAENESLAKQVFLFTKYFIR